jgi:hypothetical protein
MPGLGVMGASGYTFDVACEMGWKAWFALDAFSLPRAFF